jgi:hypothetical protein
MGGLGSSFQARDSFSVQRRIEMGGLSLNRWAFRFIKTAERTKADNDKELFEQECKRIIKPKRIHLDQPELKAKSDPPQEG